MPRSCTIDNTSRTTNSSTAVAALQPVVAGDDRLAAVREIRQRRRGITRSRAAVGEQVDLAVRLERPCGEHDDHEQQRRAEHRQRDRPEPPRAAGAVDRRGFVELLGDALQPGGDEDEREPRLDHTLDIATDQSAVPGSRSSPGRLSTGIAESSHPTLVSDPTSGCRRNSHISDATATEVATVDEKIMRNTPMPRRCLFASTANPTPSTSPNGTVISGNLNVTPERVLELDRAERIPVLVPAVRTTVAAVRVAALAPEQHRRTSG